MTSPSRRISIAFFGIVLFVTSQLVWWNIFFARYTTSVTKRQLAQWKLDQQMMRSLFRETLPAKRADLLVQCQRYHPHLNCQPPMFAVKVEARGKVLYEKQRYSRMFLFEGCFFFLVFLGGLWLLWLGIRAERELKERQQNFLSAVSHEMRTPISTMRLLLETLQLRTLKPEKKEKYLSRMGKQVDRLQHTCEQVVAAAMLDHGKAQKDMHANDLNSQVEAIVEQMRSELEERGATVAWTSYEEELPTQIDPNALSLVLNNLLENAVKYNPKEAKEVRVGVSKEGNWAMVWVEDNGPGIAAEEQSKVFKPFYRVGQELTRKKDGLGLGLYLVKGLTESMHGRVSYEALSEGSRFVLRWPMLPAGTHVPAKQA